MSNILYNKLFDFQKQIVDKYKHLNTLGLFLDMGLGKTITSLALCEANRVSHIIIISIKAKSSETIKTAGSFDDYLNMSGFEIYKHNKIKDVHNYMNEEKQRHALIFNYEALKLNDKKQLPDFLKTFIRHSKGNIALILDESHKVKNASSQRSKNIALLIRVLKSAPHFFLYLLTGTPFTQGFLDLHHQLVLLGLQMSKTLFLQKFAIRGNIRGLYVWQQPIIGYYNVEELYALVHKYAITELSETNIKLPQQVFIYFKMKSNLTFELFTREYVKKKIWASYLTKYRAYNPEIKEIHTNPLFRNFAYPNDDYYADTAAAFWLRARQLAVGFQGNAEKYTLYDTTRRDELKKFLSENMQNYVIFYNYTPELDLIFTVCEELGYLIDVYNGSIKILNNYEEYNPQEPTLKKRVIITNFQSGSEGKNWQKYNHVIFFSIPLYSYYAQALKRCHRIGQKNTVYYYIFYQNNFLENNMLLSLTQKIKYNEDMFEHDLEEWNDRNSIT